MISQLFFPKKSLKYTTGIQKKPAVSVFPGFLGKGKQDRNIELKVNETEVKDGIM